MKKIMAVLSAMFVLACGMMMTGCELKEALENLVGPKDKWCEKEFTYKTDDAENPQTSTITCYMFYSDKGIAAGTSGYKTDFTVPAGLTLVAIADSTNNAANVIGENKYVMKTLAKDAKLNGNGDTEAEGKFEMNETLWNLICVVGDSSIPDSASKSIPDPVANNAKGEKYTELKELGDFKWKKIIAQILIDKLLEEDTE